MPSNAIAPCGPTFALILPLISPAASFATILRTSSARCWSVCFGLSCLSQGMVVLLCLGHHQSTHDVLTMHARACIVSTCSKCADRLDAGYQYSARERHRARRREPRPAFVIAPPMSALTGRYFPAAKASSVELQLTCTSTRLAQRRSLVRWQIKRLGFIQRFLELCPLLVFLIHVEFDRA